MTDLNDHPFSPASVAAESGEASTSERAWFAFCAVVEKALSAECGQPVNLDCCSNDENGVSLDMAYDYWRAGAKPQSLIDAVKWFVHPATKF